VQWLHAHVEQMYVFILLQGLVGLFHENPRNNNNLHFELPVRGWVPPRITGTPAGISGATLLSGRGPFARTGHVGRLWVA